MDEVDNILIDEARTPLIISGPAEESTRLVRADFAQVVRRLHAASDDYTMDEKAIASSTLTDEGIDTRSSRHDRLGAGQNLYDAEHSELTPYLDNALRANVLFKRDKDYIVKDGEVIIVDEFTGRLMYGRRYSRRAAPGHRGQGRRQGSARER